MPYGREEMAAVAQDFCNRGFAVWNIEYRRVGSTGGGWPGTCEDAVTAIEHLANMAAAGTDLNLERVAVVGHSAGGYLALWSAAQLRHRNPTSANRIQIKAVVGEAAVTDLKLAYDMGIGAEAVAEFMGATPDKDPGLYHAASLRTSLPIGVPQLLIHGTADGVVPVATARAYTSAAIAAGDQAELLEVYGAGHMEFLDPSSVLHTGVCDWIGLTLGETKPHVHAD